MDNDKFQKLVVQQFQVMNEQFQAIDKQFQSMDLQFEAITGELDALKEGQARIEGRMDKLEKSQDILATEIIAVKSKTNEVNNGLTRLAMRIENEIEPRIEALYDGQEQHTKQLNRIEEQVSRHDERLNSIEINTGYLVFRVDSLEKLVK